MKRLALLSIVLMGMGICGAERALALRHQAQGRNGVVVSGNAGSAAAVSGQERTVIVIDPNTGLMSGAGDPEAVPARAIAAF